MPYRTKKVLQATEFCWQILGFDLSQFLLNNTLCPNQFAHQCICGFCRRQWRKQRADSVTSDYDWDIRILVVRNGYDGIANYACCLFALIVLKIWCKMGFIWKSWNTTMKEMISIPVRNISTRFLRAAFKYFDNYLIKWKTSSRFLMFLWEVFLITCTYGKIRLYQATD